MVLKLSSFPPITALKSISSEYRVIFHGQVEDMIDIWFVSKYFHIYSHIIVDDTELCFMFARQVIGMRNSMGANTLPCGTKLIFL